MVHAETSNVAAASSDNPPRNYERNKLLWTSGSGIGGFIPQDVCICFSFWTAFVAFYLTGFGKKLYFYLHSCLATFLSLEEQTCASMLLC